MEPLAFQDPPGQEVNIKAEIQKAIRDQYEASVKLVRWLYNRLTEDQAAEGSNLVQTINRLAGEKFQLAQLDGQWWQWVAAQLYFRLFDEHLEDLMELSPSQSDETPPEPRVIDIREVLASRLKPGKATKPPA